MGGTFTSETKIRPGSYVNVKSNSLNAKTSSERGIIALPLPLSFGESKVVMEIDNSTNLQNMLGYSITDEKMLLIKETLKRGNRILLYRLNSGTKASKTVDALTVTAKYAGVRGNDIIVSIASNVDTEDFTVETYLAGRKVDSQVGKNISDLVSNNFVEFSGEGALVANAGIVLESGADGEVTGQDYIDFLAEIEKYKFNILAITAEDVTDIKDVIKTFIKRLRENEGKKVQVVISNFANADYEGIISVKNGVVLENGTVINAAKACAYVAGIMAAADVNKSNTYETYDGAVKTDVIYTNNEIEEALKNGEIVFVNKNDKVVIEQDINTLVTYTLEKNEYFHKNRVVRCIDALEMKVSELFENYYIGKVNNDEGGRTLFKSAVIKLINTDFVQKGAITNFSNEDVTVEAGSDIDSLKIEIGIYPVDSMEKLYATIILKGGNE